MVMFRINSVVCYDILDLGKQLQSAGMLVILDSILNIITKNTYIFIDEIYLLFNHEYSVNFLFALWRRVRKYGHIVLVLIKIGSILVPFLNKKPKNTY